MYNIIWADDETAVYALKKPNGENTILANILERKGVRLIDTAKNAQELREKLSAKISWVDAVIIDANFTAFGEKPKSERVLKGFEESVNILKTLGENGNRIPFILFTGRDLALISDNTEEDYLKYFLDNNLYFSKIDDETEAVIDRLIEEVDRVNTPEHQIRCRYSKAFHAASLIDGAEDELMRCLLFDYKTDVIIEDVKEKYNAIRKVFENLYAACKRKGILPKLPLNSIPRLLDKGECDPYKLLVDDLMHPTLVRSLWYFLDITQDGSHEGDELTLDVIDYLKESRSVSLLQSVTHIAMDLLLWYKNVIRKDFGGDIWTGCYKYEGYVKETKTYNSSYFTLDEFNIEKKESLEDCDYIGIKDFGPDEKFPGRKRVRKFQYDIIEKHR